MLPKGKSLCREDLILAVPLPSFHSRGKGGGAASRHHKASAGITSRRVVLGELLRHPRHPPGAGRCDRDPWELLCSLSAPSWSCSWRPHKHPGAPPAALHICPGQLSLPAVAVCDPSFDLWLSSRAQDQTQPSQAGLLPDHCPTNVSGSRAEYWGCIHFFSCG